jgi:hypothetical protein
MNANTNSNHLPLPRFQSTIEDVLRFKIEKHKRCGFKPLRYVIFDGDLDSDRIYMQTDHLADAVTTTLQILQSKRENRTSNDYHIYSVSLWQVHKNGTFHRVGYAEDHQTFEDMKLGLPAKLNAAIWRGIDNALADKLAHYIFD